VKRTIIYPGTFDPITLGHLDVIEDCTYLFDKVIVAIMINKKKKPMFSEKERLAIIRESVQESGFEYDANIEVISFHGLTTVLAKERGAVAMVRGLRLTTEYEVELNLALNNQKLAPKIRTVFLPPHQEHINISSSAFREILSFNEKDILEQYVPQAVLRRIK
jgi:pantetheine-phosphate adenylyltransferase